jgi:predicted permease
MRALLHTLVARVRGFLRPGDLDADFDRELDAHLAIAQDDLVRRGLTAEEARRAARVKLGGRAQLREAGRAARGLPWLSGFWLDIKLGLRLLVKHRGLTLVPTVALAVAIAIVAGFHAGTNFFVRPTLPVPEGDRVVAVWNIDAGTTDRGRLTVGDMLTWREDLDSLDDVGAFTLQPRVVAAANGPTRLVRAAEISPSAFPMLRVPPLLGRPLVEDDERAGGPSVALIGFELWQTAFGGETAIVGRTIRVGDVEHAVVGVMPRGFGFPLHEQLWTPLRIPVARLGPGEGPNVDFAIGRLASGFTLEQAEAELQVTGARMAADQPRTHAGLRPRIASYARSFLDANEPGLPLLMSAARVLMGIVLLVVAVNVGTLVYARNAARVGEIAVRMALGASPRRIAVQMFAESLVLAMLAAIVGVAIMLWPIDTLREVFGAAGDDIPYWFDIRLGGSTFLLIGGLVVLSAVLTGVLPALKLTDRNMQARLQRVREGGSGLRFGRTATLVVVSQVALTVALLTVGGAQLLGFIEDLASVEDDPMAREEYLTAELRWDLGQPGDGGRPGTDDLERRAAAWRTLGRGVSQEPDVRGVTFSSFLGVRPFGAEGTLSAGPVDGTRWAGISAIEPNFFDVHGRQVLAGRGFDAGDLAESDRRPAIVNEAFVRRTLGSLQPLGQRIQSVDPRTGRPTGEAVEIVGVVGDFLAFEISQRGPGWVAHPTVYLPLNATAAAETRLMVRVREDPAGFIGRLRSIAAQTDPTMVLHRLRPLEDVDRVSAVFIQLYAFAVGFLVFAVLVLSAAGIYSMMSFTVAQRTREIGIRTALGANPMRVIGEIFARALTQLGAGTLLGLVLGMAAAAGPFPLSDSPFDQGPGLILAVAGIVLGLGLIGCGIPMKRALRIEPTEALRDDG